MDTHGAIVLLHSPLTSSTAWGRVPRELEALGHTAIVPDVHGDNRPPYAVRYVASAADQTRSRLAELGVSGAVLVGHSGAGPLLPQLAGAVRAGGGRVDGYVFADAGLPRAGATRLALWEEENRAEAGDLQAHLTAGGLFPEWTFDDLAASVPDPDARRDLLAGLRPRGIGFFTEEIAVPGDWPDAPCGYLLLSPAYEVHTRTAAHRGWPVHQFGASHFAAINDPAGFARALAELLASL